MLIAFEIISVNNKVAVRAIKKALVVVPEQNLAAIRASLTNPKILLPIEKIMIIKTDFPAFLERDKQILQLKHANTDWFNLKLLIGYFFCLLSFSFNILK